MTAALPRLTENNVEGDSQCLSTRGRLVTRFQGVLFKLSWVLASGRSVRLMDALFSLFFPLHVVFLSRGSRSINHFAVSVSSK